MRVVHQIEAELVDVRSGPRPGSDAFVKRFRAHQTGPTTVFAFDDGSSADEAIAFLSERGIPGTHFYLFEMDPHEVETHPAFYLGIVCVVGLITNGKVNPRKMGRNDLATDYASEHILVSRRARAMLEHANTEAIWHDVPGHGAASWSRMEVTREIPDPIFIPHPIEHGENVDPPGTHWVRSDGRDVIADASATFLQGAGVALSPRFRLGSEQVQTWRPRWLVSGRVLAALVRKNVTGLLLPPVPLLAAVVGDPRA